MRDTTRHDRKLQAERVRERAQEFNRAVSDAYQMNMTVDMDLFSVEHSGLPMKHLNVKYVGPTD